MAEIITRKAKIGVIQFLGTNCERETKRVMEEVLGAEAAILWNGDKITKTYDALILPGGFANGDHLRAGAIASHSSVMESVKEYAEKGKLVLGICNGFQVLCEAGLLPGALTRNSGMRFRSQLVDIRVENNQTIFTNLCQQGQVLRMPIAHGEGNYTIPINDLKNIEKNGQVLFRYSTPEGQITVESNPNGSINNIAGITNRNMNVMGLMPHPERASEWILGGEDGKFILGSLIRSIVLQ